MSCGCHKKNNTNKCTCDFNVKVFGLCDTSKVKFSNSSSLNYKIDYNWTEISVPEILCVPKEKPDIEHIDQVFVDVDITCIKLIETPKYLSITNNKYDLDSDGFPIPKPNEEGTNLTGRKLIIEGVLNQKVVYTAEVACQSVHSAHYQVPFSAFIIVYPKFENDELDVDEAVVDLNELFCVNVCIEDVFIKRMDARTIFKNVTLFLSAKPKPNCDN